jgi:hypothetical protein
MDIEETVELDCEEAIETLARGLDVALSMAAEAQARFLIMEEFFGSKTWGHM